MTHRFDSAVRADSTCDQAFRERLAPQQSEPHLGKADSNMFGGQGNPVMAGQCELKASAERAAINGRDHWHVEGFQCTQLPFDGLREEGQANNSAEPGGCPYVRCQVVG